MKLGLPERLEGHEQPPLPAPCALRLAEHHPVVKQVVKAKRRLTQPGFGPWATIYRKTQGRERRCVQLAILSWDALHERSWPGVSAMESADVGRVLGTYAQRVITPRGSAAVSGLELMTALHPPTRAVQDPQTGKLGARPQPWLARDGADGPGPTGGHRRTPRRRALRLERRHRAAEFKKFLIRIDKVVPAHLQIHLIVDNYGTHKTPAIKAWLAKHPRFELHFTPTRCSWINQVERWSGYVAHQMIHRGAHKNIQALQADSRA
jgi:hypothetical protein